MAIGTVQATVPFTDPQNNVVANGTLTLDLSQPAEITSGGGQVDTKRVSIALTSGGLISPAVNLWKNDQLTPSGTTYRARLFDSGGNLVADFGQWSITGASPVDLSQIIPVSTSAVSNPAPVLQQPSSTQVINGQTLTMEGAALGFSAANSTTPDVGISRNASGVLVFGNGTLNDNTAILKPSNINSVIWVDGVRFTTLAGAYAALPSTGGTVCVPPGYTETLSSNLALTKAYAGFLFMGAATITMGANQVTMAGGIHGAFIKSVMPSRVQGTSAVGTDFVYTGTGTAFVLGDTTADSFKMCLENINVDVHSAGSSAVGINLRRIIYSAFNYVHISHIGGVNSQIGWLLDGTNNFCGDNTFTGIVVGGGPVHCMQFTNGSSANIVNGFSPAGGLAAGGTCLDFLTNSSGNTVFNADIENCATAVHFDNSAGTVANRIYITNSQGNTTEVLADSGNGGGNFVDSPGSASGTVTLNNTNNYVNSGFNPLRGSVLLNQQGASAALTGNSGDQALFSYTLPAGTIGKGKGLKITVGFLHNVGTASTAHKLKFGSTVFDTRTYAVTQANTSQESFEFWIFNNSGVQNAQNYWVKAWEATGTSGALAYSQGAGTGAVDFTASQAITYTFNVANTDQETPKVFLVEVVQ